MFKVQIEESDRKDCLLTLRLNVNNTYESDLIINPYDCFDNFISRPTDMSLDVLYFTSIIYAIDKIIQRTDTYDNWSRDIEVVIPVRNLDCWNNAKDTLKLAVDFLTSDNWIFNFRSLGDISYFEKEETLDLNISIDKICLFSGGLDSLAGAINLIDENNNILLISHIDGSGSSSKLHHELLSNIRTEYNQKNIRQSFFHVYTKDSLAHEGTTRGRSILFHGIALFHAINLGINEIITPENGVISINLPLTPSRTCSNSTKTMHPYFIKKFEEALMLIGLQIQINNPYLLKTKGEMLVENRNPDLIQQLATKTLSCSHGGGHTPGWHRHSLNCGYCIPCTIRRASIHKFNANLDKCTDYGHKLNSQEINLSIHEKRLDLLALAYFLNKELTKDELKREIKLMANIDNIDNVADMLLRSYAEIKQYVYDKADDNIKGLFTCQLV
ncbi:MAG: Qat anti-phage system QueC-like protein QatC [Arcobacter sp.]|jgi:7-cyano-7-deazaguanine synthase in queuosine biosynthesis|uniref:Qat anti-phage system QueC-like protein QatC n=1 Tax=Arcobacter sp. TaxID=1872629 RepID=UPI002A75C989|nr:Qat anti-phage system QueC-like protein QatC [Arcobacter sp.]MDY3203918.1 Qat anti-phage system QueC-like protein QatC [Arcobacter sp.]